MSSTPLRIIIVDNDPEVCAHLASAVGQLGFETHTLTDPLQFSETLAAVDPAALIVDLKMPGCDGIQLLSLMRSARCTAQIIMISGMDQKVLNTASKLGRSYGLNVLGTLKKPIKPEEIESLLRRLGHGQPSSDELLAAISENQLVVHYQPQIALRDGAWAISGAEALVRWQHPRYGLLMPLQFIPLADQSNSIGMLTDHVLRDSLSQLRKWRALGLNLTVSVNLTAGILDDMEFPNRLQQLLTQFDVPSSSLTLELTEHAAMADPTKVMDTFLRLLVSDVNLSIDDYGTGYSSLQQLYELPFSELKIDRAFIKNLPDEQDACAIVRATIEMAHALGMTVCAEGVETQTTLRHLESLHCDKVQGFLIGRPVSAAEFEQVIGPWRGQTLRRASRERG